MSSGAEERTAEPATQGAPVSEVGTGAVYVPPGRYVRSDGVRCCAHAIPVGPGSCPDCHSLTDEHWESGCTCVIDAYEAQREETNSE